MSTHPPTLAVRELRDDELQTAAAVLARGMRDNPGHVAAFGDDPQRRRRCLQRMFTAVFEGWFRSNASARSAVVRSLA